jgi:kynureninase
MPQVFSPIPGAQGFQQSNPSVLATASLLGSLQIFQAVGGVQSLRARSVGLTGLLEELLHQSTFYVPPTAVGDAVRFGFTIITPEEQDSRGAQLSLLFLPAGSGLMQKIFAYLRSNGVIGDERNPDVIRLAPAPLYNTEEECIKAVEVLNRGLQEAKVTA